MSWERFSTVPGGYGVTGGAAQLTAAQRVRLVDCQIGGPATWCVVLQSNNSCTFTVEAGNGQAVQVVTQVVKGGRHYLTVVAQTLQVNALAGSSACSIYASAAPDNGPQGSPGAVVTSSLALLPSAAQTIEASGRVRAIIHNNTSGNVSVRLNNVDLYRMTTGTTIEIAWAGAFSVVSTIGGNVNVAELFQ